MGIDSGPASADGVGSRANSGANSASADGGRTDEKGGKRSDKFEEFHRLAKVIVLHYSAHKLQYSYTAVTLADAVLSLLLYSYHCCTLADAALLPMHQCVRVCVCECVCVCVRVCLCA